MQEEIVYFLKKAKQYVSGEEISQSLKISRSAVWKYVEELRRRGYDIVAVPHLGYRLAGSADKLFPHEIQYELKTALFGKRIVYHETIASTMDEAFQLALEGASEGTVVCAEAQTKGRGRLGRLWDSPKGKGIYISVILRPKLSLLQVTRLTLLSAVAAAEAIKTVSGLSPLIKWPNDLIYKNRKLAGILTELSADTDRVKFVILGLGINVNSPLHALPAGATSLKHETQKQQSRIHLLQEILRELERWYLCLTQEGFDPLMRRWQELSLTMNQRVRVVDSSLAGQAGLIEGEAVGIDQDGGLLIRQDSGVITKKMAGDVVQAG